jgi:hypothetical protein
VAGLTPPYDGYLKTDLEAEADKRGVDRSDEPLKSDLIARLEAYDREHDEATTQEVPAETNEQPEQVPEAPQRSAPITPERGPWPPEPVVTDTPALGAVQQRIEGHQPTPYPSDEDLRNRVVNAFTPDLIPNPPPIEDLTVIGQVNVDEVNVGESTRSS